MCIIFCIIQLPTGPAGPWQPIVLTPPSNRPPLIRSPTCISPPKRGPAVMAGLPRVPMYLKRRENTTRNTKQKQTNIMVVLHHFVFKLEPLLSPGIPILSRNYPSSSVAPEAPANRCGHLHFPGVLKAPLLKPYSGKQSIRTRGSNNLLKTECPHHLSIRSSSIQLGRGKLHLDTDHILSPPL